MMSPSLPLPAPGTILGPSPALTVIAHQLHMSSNNGEPATQSLSMSNRDGRSSMYTYRPSHDAGGGGDDGEGDAATDDADHRLSSASTAGAGRKVASSAAGSTTSAARRGAAMEEAESERWKYWKWRRQEMSHEPVMRRQ
jgi:hypothetical protein